ncbi:MAG: hypothetical protein JXQ73_21770 [Phycisphaerae bacterium]|nr:hypothetical protein [Phycisphaerae bacterium]
MMRNGFAAAVLFSVVTVPSPAQTPQQPGAASAPLSEVAKAPTTTTAPAPPRIMTSSPAQTVTTPQGVEPFQTVERTHWQPVAAPQATGTQAQGAPVPAGAQIRSPVISQGAQPPTQQPAQTVYGPNRGQYIGFPGFNGPGATYSRARGPRNTGAQTWQQPQYDTHWQQSATSANRGWGGAYRPGFSTARGSGYANNPRSVSPDARASFDLYSPRTGAYSLGYQNRDGTVDQLDTRTGTTFFGVRNGRGGQDMFDSRSGRWLFGHKNRDGTMDYFDPRTGRWILSTGRGGPLP